MRSTIKYGKVVLIVILFIAAACSDKPRTMSISTEKVGEVGQRYAVVQGDVIDLGDNDVLGYGFCYATTPDPDINDSLKIVGGTPAYGTYSLVLDVEPGSSYFVRAFIYDGHTAEYGSTMNFKTRDAVVVKDYDLYGYKTEYYGEQLWFTRNLTIDKLNDGTSLTSAEDNAIWRDLTEAGVAWYGNDKERYETAIKGVLYNWAAVKTGRLCPDGWHIPNEAEWNELIAFFGGQLKAGREMKSANKTYWQLPIPGATNDFKFSAFPTGFRDGTGAYFSDKTDAYWWSSTEESAASALGWRINHATDNINRETSDKDNAYAIRCIKTNDIPE